MGNGTKTGRNNEPKPPAGLSPQAKRLWRRIFDASDIDEVARPLLDAYCEDFDERQEGRAILAREGPVIVDKTAAGLERKRLHPAQAIVHNATGRMLRTWRLLGFDQVPPEGV